MGSMFFYHIHALIFNISYVFVMSKLPIKICSGLNHIITLKNSHSQHFSTYFIAYLDSVWDSSFWNLWDIPLVHLQSLHMLKNRKRKHSFRRAKWSYSAVPLCHKALHSSQREKRSAALGGDHITYRCEHLGKRKNEGTHSWASWDSRVSVWKWIPINHIYKTALPSSRM